MMLPACCKSVRWCCQAVVAAVWWCCQPVVTGVWWCSSLLLPECDDVASLLLLECDDVASLLLTECFFPAAGLLPPEPWPQQAEDVATEEGLPGSQKEAITRQRSQRAARFTRQYLPGQHRLVINRSLSFVVSVMCVCVYVCVCVCECVCAGAVCNSCTCSIDTITSYRVKEPGNTCTELQS